MKLIDEELRRQKNNRLISLGRTVCCLFDLIKIWQFPVAIRFKKSFFNLKMKILALIILPSIFSEETRATLEFQLANLSHAGFSVNLENQKLARTASLIKVIVLSERE